MNNSITPISHDVSLKSYYNKVGQLTFVAPPQRTKGGNSPLRQRETTHLHCSFFQDKGRPLTFIVPFSRQREDNSPLLLLLQFDQSCFHVHVAFCFLAETTFTI